jgi:hypothetical protein
MTDSTQTPMFEAMALDHSSRKGRTLSGAAQESPRPCCPVSFNANSVWTPRPRRSS